MQNDFEHKVKQKMEEFVLSPTDAVWQNVALRIAKEKKRKRIIFFWWTVAIVLVGGTLGLIIVKPGNKFTKEETQQLSSVESKKKETSDLKTNDATSTNESIEKQAEKVETKTDDNKTNRTNNQLIREDKEVGVKKVVADKSNKISRPPVTKNINRNEPSSSGSVKKKANEISASKESKNISHNPIAATGSEEEKTSASSLLPRANDYKHNPAKVVAQEGKTLKSGGSDSLVIQQDTLVATVKEKPPTKQFDTTTIASITKANKVTSSKSIKPIIGFTLYAGVSDNITGFPLLPGEEKSFDAGPSYQTGSGSVIVGPNRLQYKTGFSFGFGAFVQQALTRRWSLIAGIDYHYLSTSTATGGKVNGVLNFFDSSLNTNVTLRDYYNAYPATNFSAPLVTYTNRYHFVQLPVNFQFNLNGANRRPFILSAGVTPGYMVGSHALNFNRYRQVSYTDKDQFTKFQLSAQGGFSFNLVNAKKCSIQLGPELRYGISNLSKSSTDTRQHLIFFGLKANVTPGPKGRR